MGGRRRWRWGGRGRLAGERVLWGGEGVDMLGEGREALRTLYTMCCTGAQEHYVSSIKHPGYDAMGS